MNSRCCAFIWLLLLSGSAFAADTSLPPMSPVGLWLITLGIVFLIAEAVLPNYGVIGLGGIIMFVIGALSFASCVNTSAGWYSSSGVSGRSKAQG